VPSAILNSPNWIRSVEKLYPGQEFTGIPLAPSYNALTNPVYPGQVLHVVNNQVVLADQGTDSGKFFGIMYSEVSAIIDELQGNTITPVIIRGPATVTVNNLNSAGGALLISSPALILSATTTVELVAVGGLLKVRGAETGPTVATLNNVLSDRIEIQLAAPSASGGSAA
jgi:hypothetical protein